MRCAWVGVVPVVMCVPAVRCVWVGVVPVVWRLPDVWIFYMCITVFRTHCMPCMDLQGEKHNQLSDYPNRNRMKCPSRSFHASADLVWLQKLVFYIVVASCLLVKPFYLNTQKK